MPRKPPKGYFVKGQFVAEGSAQDLRLKAERKGRPDASRTDRKRASDRLQTLGKELLGLRADLFEALALPDPLVEALAEARRISDFEGKRRQMQYVGKIMRRLDPERVQAAYQALDAQHKGSATEKLQLHLAEQWRDRLLADDEALAGWMATHPDTDAQQLRALIRQARKDTPSTDKTALAPRKGRAHRELFRQVRRYLGDTGPMDTNGADGNG